MKLYAVGLTRAILPLLKHRLAKVRVAAIDAIRRIVQVPNRDKRKGAGTEAITDFVGFREDNVIPVGAFYRPEVSINYLAEVVQDSNSMVREHVAETLADWLINLPDRYDYESRLLPYLLNFCNDSIEVCTCHYDIGKNCFCLCEMRFILCLACALVCLCSIENPTNCS